MADERNMRNDGADALSVRVTVIAVRRVAAMAERALREQGYTEDDALLQDVLAAQLIAEDSLAMEQAGDPLAEPMAREALSIAKEALKAARGEEVEEEAALQPPEEEGGEPRDVEGEGQDAGALEPAPVAILSEATAGSAAEGSRAAAAAAAPAEPATETQPAPEAPVAAVPAAALFAGAARDPSAAAPRASARDDDALAQGGRGLAPAGASAQEDSQPAPAFDGNGSAPAVDALRPRHAALRPERIDLPEVFAAPAPAPVPTPAAAPAPALEPQPVSAPGPVRAPEPAAPRARGDRGFSIPYGPAAGTAEDAFFAPAPGPASEPASPEPPAPAGAAPDSTAPAGPARRPESAARSRKPRAAKRVCAALAVVLVMLAGAVGAAWWGFFDLPAPVQERIELLPDAHAREGRLNASEAEVAPGSYQLVVNQVATMDAGSRTLPVAFENPEANEYSSRLALALDGEVLAETGMVAPGFYVESVELSRTLPPGEHDVDATVYVYSGATQVNTMSANVTVRVK